MLPDFERILLRAGDDLLEFVDARRASNEAVRRAIERTGGPPGDRVMCLPADASAYLPGANEIWDHACLQCAPDQRQLPDLWHQFAMFGGYPIGSDQEHLTFLQMFLMESDL